MPPSTPAAGFCKATHPERVIGVDTETFYPWPAEGEITASERRRCKDGKAHPLAVDSRRNGIRLLTVNTGLEIRVFDLFVEMVPDDIRELLRTSTLVIHNADFDITVLRRHGFEVSDAIFDTLLASQLLSLGKVNPKRGGHTDLDPDDTDNDDPHDDQEDPDLEDGFDAFGDLRPADNDLASVMRRYLNVTMKKAEANLGASDWGSGTITSEQLVYTAGDVAHLPDLVVALTKELKAAKLWECFRERSEFFVNLNNIRFAGVPVNRDQLLRDQQATEALKQEKRAEVAEMFKDFRPPIPKSRRKKSSLVAADDLFQGAVLNAETTTEEFNPNVSAQVVEALALRGVTVENAKKKTLSVIDSPETRLLVEYSDQKALLTTINGIAKNVFPDTRVRAGSWNQLAAKTGRIHSNQPNLQNLPRNWRAIFEAPAPYQWLKIDLSQIEMYVLAIHCQEEVLIDLLASGKDIYVEVAARLFGKKPIRGEGFGEVTEILRKSSKELTLGISYCMGPRTFIIRVEIKTRPRSGGTGKIFTLDEAKEFQAGFFAMFPAIAANQGRAEIDALSAECVYTVTGQRRFLPPLLDDRDEESGYWPSMQFRKRVLVNTPIQGSAANLYIRAINKFMPQLPPEVQTVNLVHDEVNLLITPDTEQEVVGIVTRAFEESFSELFGNRLKVKLDHKLRKTWGVEGDE